MVNQNAVLREIVNRSGYAFNLGVAAAIKNSCSRQKWQLEAPPEVPWCDDEGEMGFVDLTIKRDRTIGVIECKKVNNSDQLVFLLTEDQSDNVTRCRLDVYHPKPTMRSGTLPLEDRFDTVECNMVTGSPESMYCAATKSEPSSGGKPGTKSANLNLDKVASDLLGACEGLLGNWSTYLPEHTACAPIIVTNARLYTCRFDPAAMDLVSAALPENAAFKPIEFVRFRKAFRRGAGNSTSNERDLTGAVAEGERTVFVVDSQHLLHFLASLRQITCKYMDMDFVLVGGA